MTKPDPEKLHAEAEGEFTIELFRSVLGAFSYHSNKSVYHRLHDNKKIQYLFVNRASLEVVEKASSIKEKFEPSEGYSAVAVVTDQRIFFVVGRKEEHDQFIVVPVEQLIRSSASGNSIRGLITFETDSAIFRFSVTSQKSSYPEVAVEYLENRIVSGITEPKDANQIIADGGDTTESQSSAQREGVDSESAKTANGGSRNSSDDEVDSQSFANLSAFERDILYVTNGLDDPTGVDIKRELDMYYGEEINHGRLYPNLDSLDEAGLIDKFEVDARSNGYKLTDIGAAHLKARMNWKASAVDNSLTHTDESEMVNNSKNDKKSDSNQSTATATRKKGDNLESVFISDPQAVSGPVRQQLRDAAQTLQQTNTAEDSLLEAIQGLESATDRLQNVADEPGVATGRVQQAIDRLESRHENLITIRSAFALAKRKLALSGGGMRIPESDAVEAQAMVKEAITLGEKLGRSTSELEAYLDRLEEEIEVVKSNGEETHRSSKIPADDESEEQNEAVENDSGFEFGGAEPATEKQSRKELLDAIEGIYEELGRRPKMGELDDRTEYNSLDIYAYFNTWDDAIKAANVETPKHEDLIEELRRLESKLGYAPLFTQIEEYSQFTPYEYQQQFDSIDEALTEANIDVKSQVVEIFRELLLELDTKPTISDFESESPYSASVLYKYFDGIDEAIDAASPETTRNELSERYETVRNLHTVCGAIAQAGEDRDVKEYDERDPMATWVSKIEERLNDNADGYGVQQRDRNPFSMQDYRERYGDGNRVTEFEYVQVRPPTTSVQALFDPLIEGDPTDFFLPVDAETDSTMPVIVESADELTRALAKLARLPSQPEAASDQRKEKTRETDEDKKSSPAPDTGNLLDINVITEDIAQTLQDAGYVTQNDLKTASMEELAEVDGISEQIAMRMKLQVGG